MKRPRCQNDDAAGERRIARFGHFRCREIREAPKARGAERIYLPGEMEWERRETALREGIVLPPDVVASVAALAEELGVPIPGMKSES